ncbi:MAG TPA: glycosyltransferase family 39 protein, partial [Gaiellaceae bacterium]|nr:glycosyltransferase family 39 protein [Gaiellaceae bacterium]
TLVAGRSEWALRFLSIVGSMLACGLLVILAHRFFERRVALVAGLLLAASPFVVKWSQQARGYTLGLAASLLATLLLLRALDRGTRRAWVVYGLALSLVVVWHPVVGVLLVPVHAVLAWQRRDAVLPHGLLAAIVAGAFAVPWAALVALRSTGEGVAMDWLTFPSLETAVWAVADVSGALGVGAVLAVVGVVALRRAGRSELATWLGVWAAAPFALSLLVSLVRPIYLDRYLLVAAPAFALLAAVALFALAPRVRLLAASALAAATAFGVVQWYALGVNGNWRGEDWRSATALVLERRAEADAVVVAPWSAAPAARYYGAEVVDVSTADRIWVLAWSETAEETTAEERRALGFGEHRLVERAEFGRRLSADLWERPG